MAWLPNPIACDVCGVVKQPSNHWYYAEIVAHTEENPGFTIWPWDYPAEDRSKPYVHLCGQVCVIRKLNEWMGGSDNQESRPALKPDPAAPRPGSSFEQANARMRRELARAALDLDLATDPKTATHERTMYPAPQSAAIQPEKDEKHRC